MLIFPVCLLYHKYSDRLQEKYVHIFFNPSPYMNEWEPFETNGQNL